MLYNPRWKQPVDLAKPSLIGLVYLLRHKEMWPSGFTWNWVDPDHCAMGLVCSYWGLNARPDPEVMSMAFNLPLKDARHLFMVSGHVWKFWGPTPAETARRIERHVSKQR